MKITLTGAQISFIAQLSLTLSLLIIPTAIANADSLGLGLSIFLLIFGYVIAWASFFLSEWIGRQKGVKDLQRDIVMSVRDFEKMTKTQKDKALALLHAIIDDFEIQCEDPSHSHYDSEFNTLKK